MSWTKFVFATDSHGDMQDDAAVNIFFKFMAEWKPTLRIHGGDAFDLRPLRKGASEDEKRESIRADITAGKKFLKRMAPTHFLRGNHDERLWELAENGKGVAQDYASAGVEELTQLTKELGCQMLPYHKRLGVLRIGNLKMIHGFAGGIYAARQHALVYGSCLFGHIHAIDEHAIAGLDRRVARSVGCLCQLDMDYNSRQMNTLRQANGWAYGVINDKTGNYFVTQAESVDGVWMIPSDFKQV